MEVVTAQFLQVLPPCTGFGIGRCAGVHAAYRTGPRYERTLVTLKREPLDDSLMPLDAHEAAEAVDDEAKPT